jgi:hypothetical protein
MQKRLHAAIAATVALTLTAAACGDDDDATDTTSADDASAPTAAATAASVPGTGAASDTEDTDTDSGGSGDDGGTDAAAGSAVVTVDGETFTLDQEMVCIEFGGAVAGSFATEAGDASFDVDLPPEDWESRPAEEEWEAPSVRLDDDRADAPLSWRAGGEVVDGMTGVPPEVEVTSYSIDGASAIGTATVVEINRIGIEDAVVAEMEFEFSCG